MKCTIFSDVTSSRLVEVHQISDEYNVCIFGTEDWAKQVACKKLVASSMFLGNIRELPLNYTVLHPRKWLLFTVIIVRTSDPITYISDIQMRMLTEQKCIPWRRPKKFIPSGHENPILIITDSWSSNAQNFLWPPMLYFCLFTYCRKNNILICLNFFSCNWKTYGQQFS